MTVRVQRERVKTNIKIRSATAVINPCSIARLNTTSIKPSLKKPSRNEISPAFIHFISRRVLFNKDLRNADLESDGGSYCYLVRLGIFGFSVRIGT